MNEFISWCKGRGYQFDGLEITCPPPGNCGNGIYATTGFRTGKAFITLPETDMINAALVVDLPVYRKKLAKIGGEKLKPMEILTMFFAFEDTEHSAWSPYLKVLPKEFNTPAFKGIDYDVNTLPLSIRKYWIDQKKEISEISEKLRRLFPELSHDKILWAWHVVNTRCIFVENEEHDNVDNSDGDTIAVIPYVDMLNHDPEKYQAMKAQLAILSLLVGLLAAQDLRSLLDICANPPKTTPKTLSDKISLPESYKISGSMTDWMKASTSLLVESASKEFRVLEKQTRDQMPEKWIQELTGAKLTSFINVTSGECIGNVSKPDLFKISRFESIIGADTSSLYSIILGLIEFDKSHTGFFVEDHVEVVGGVNAQKWVTCIDGATANDTKVLLEVRYAGEETIRPAQSPFSNPLLLSIRLAELPNFNSTVALNHVSVELDRYELPVGNEAAVVHGVWCKNRNDTVLVLKPLDEYAAILNYFDPSTNRSDVVEVLYSKTKKVIHIAGDSFENGVKLFKATPKRYKNGTDYILHDFNYGYEFTMSHGACQSFSPLDDSSEDVLVKNGTDHFIMNNMEWLLVDPGLRFSLYESDVDMVGTAFKTYRAYDGRDETIVELHVTEDMEVHSMARFRMGSRHLAVSLTVQRIPMESSRLNMKTVQLSNCYDEQKFANNTLMVQIKDKTLSDLSQVGLNGLNEAVASSISKNVHPIIPYRVIVFYVESRDSGLEMIVRVAEKTEKKPGNVVGYNYTTELTTAEIFKLMNDSMTLDKMPIEVLKNNGVKEEWMADASTMKMYPPENDDGFIGYTGGAMFVLAIFCLLIGVSIGAVGVFVATRRQRISTLAYQVFE